MDALEIMERVERGELSRERADYELLVLEEQRHKRKQAWRTFTEFLVVALGVAAFVAELLSLFGE
jgi:hypothetical protein